MLKRLFGIKEETPTAIDQYLRTRSEEKEAIMQELKKALLKANKE